MVSVRLDLETAATLRELAQQNYNGKMADTVRGLVRASGGLSGLGSEDEGYNSGLRQGVHDAKEALRKAFTPLWRK